MLNRSIFLFNSSYVSRSISTELTYLKYFENAVEEVSGNNEIEILEWCKKFGLKLN